MGLQPASPVEGSFPMESGGCGAFFPNTLNFQFVLFGLIKIQSSKETSHSEEFSEVCLYGEKELSCGPSMFLALKWLFPFLNEKGAFCISTSLSEEPLSKSLFS